MAVVAAATDLTRPALARAAASNQPRVACFIRYQIDPLQHEGFALYAETWVRIIPRCGGHLIGYFLPWEGTNDVGWGLIGFESLAEYEAYRVRLKADPEARANLAMAATRKLILHEERNFVELARGTYNVMAG